MPVNVTVDLSGLEALLSATNIANAKAQVTQQVFDDAQQYVPVLTGQLHSTAQCDPSAGRINWMAPYANRVYNGDRVISPNISGGTAYVQWFEQAKSEHAEEWVATCFEELLKAVA